jgi:SAM-dependent methyltransferase
VARMAYDRAAAAAFRAAREIPRDGLAGWRDAIQRHLSPRPGMIVVDVGAGTGAFSTALHDWFGVRVLAVEPSEAMRALIPPGAGIEILDGSAEELPIEDSSADGAWLSTVTHHITDLPAAARELRRVLRPGAPVLIRNFFPGRPERIGMLRFFPEVRRVWSTFPSVEQTTDAFALAGFSHLALESVPQQTAPNLAVITAKLDRNADTALRSLSDAEFAAGRARLRAAAAREHGPVIDYLDLLVLG